MLLVLTCLFILRKASKLNGALLIGRIAFAGTEALLTGTKKLVPTRYRNPLTAGAGLVTFERSKNLRPATPITAAPLAPFLQLTINLPLLPKEQMIATLSALGNFLLLLVKIQRSDKARLLTRPVL